MLVVNLQPELYLPRILRGIDHSCARVQCAGSGTDIYGPAVWRIEIGMIQNVKELTTELNLSGLAKNRYFEVLDEGHVEVVDAGSFDRVSTSAAECVLRRHHKRVRIEPLTRITLAARFVRIRNRIRALACRSDIRLIVRNE